MIFIQNFYYYLGLKDESPVPEVESNQTSVSPQENFKTTLHAQIDRLRRQINENLDSFVVVTNKHLYILDWTKHPVDLSLQLCIQAGDLNMFIF